jgi:hypothetical protein
MIKRTWSAAEADEWTKEDWIVIVISPLAYLFLMLGIALSMLLLASGFVLLGIGIVLTIILHWVIDPKLKSISHEYEQNQARYIEELERTARWEGK